MLLLSLEGEDVLQAVQLLFEVFSDEGDCSLTEGSSWSCSGHSRRGTG